MMIHLPVELVRDIVKCLEAAEHDTRPTSTEEAAIELQWYHERNRILRKLKFKLEE